MGHPLIDTAESIGQFMEYWGFKSIDGRVWTLIHLSDTPISTPEIVDHLQVSKGLVSVAINELLQYDLIEAHHKTKFGAQTYISKNNVTQTIRRILRERELHLLSMSESNMEALLTLSRQELQDINISEHKLKSLYTLTLAQKNLMNKIIRRNLNTIEDWITFTKKAVQLLKF